MNSKTEYGCPLHRASKRWPGRPACVAGSRVWTYEELDCAVRNAVDAMTQRGVKQGDRVAVALADVERAIVTMFALWRLGAVSVHVNARWPHSTAIANLDHVGCTAIVTDGLKTDAIRRITVHELSSEASPSGSGPGASDPQRPASIVFTSGSTGHAKAAVHAWRCHYYSALGSNEALPIGHGDRWLLSLPLYHVGGLAIAWRCALAGAALVVPERQPDFADEITRHRVTHVSLVETQLRRLITWVDSDCMETTLKLVLVGGGPVAPELLERALELGLPACTTYGLTEMSSQVATVPPEALDRAARTSGRILPYRELRIDESGEIHVRGLTLFLGYARRDGIDPPRLDGDGWFATGDVGLLDVDGYLRVTGRRDNMFISGGENIVPEDVERAMLELPGMTACVVVPVRDTEYGRRPVAFVQHDAGITVESVQTMLSERLPGFMIPTALYPMPVVENDTMKPDRVELSTLAEQQARGS